MNEPTVIEIVRLFNEGNTLEQIAESYNMNITDLCNVLFDYVKTQVG